MVNKKWFFLLNILSNIIIVVIAWLSLSFNLRKWNFRFVLTIAYLISNSVRREEPIRVFHNDRSSYRKMSLFKRFTFSRGLSIIFVWYKLILDLNPPLTFPYTSLEIIELKHHFWRLLFFPSNLSESFCLFPARSRAVANFVVQKTC